MSARNGTSGIIWIAVALIAASIATSTMGLFMDSWRTFDTVDVDEDGKKVDLNGSSGYTGLNTITSKYDFKKFFDGYYEDECYDLIEDGTLDDEGDVECLDKNTLLITTELSEMCEEAEDDVQDIEDDGDYDSEYLEDKRDDRDGLCQTESAGSTGTILLWIGFGTAIISMILCVICAFVGHSGTRLSGGFIGMASGLLMCASAILWLTLLPTGDQDLNEGSWDLGLNFILTLVGGFLAVVAGIITMAAGKRGGKSYNAPMQAMPQQQYQQQQQQQQYPQQQQQYEQPKQYKQW